jgi:hypothetical protein
MGSSGRRRTLGTLALFVAAPLLAACAGTSDGIVPSPSEDTLSASVILEHAANALRGALSVKVHYHWTGEGPIVDAQYVVTTFGSTPAAPPVGGCVTMDQFTDRLNIGFGPTVASAKEIGGQKVIVLDTGPAWELQVLDGYPPYPIELSRREGFGRATYTFSGFNAPIGADAGSLACPPPPTPIVTTGKVSITLSDSARGTLTGDLNCATDALTTMYPRGSVTVNGNPQPYVSSVTIRLFPGPPYAITLSLLAVEFGGTVTASQVSGPNLHAHFYGPLYGKPGLVELTADVTCDALPASVVRAS